MDSEKGMSSFKDFLLRGNLVELAVAFIMASSFGKVVTATVDVIMGAIGKIGAQPDFSTWKPAGLLIGVWITAVVAFLILSVILYFFIVKPYNAAKDRYFPAEPPEAPPDIVLLQEIRDLLAAQPRAPIDHPFPLA